MILECFFLLSFFLEIDFHCVAQARLSLGLLLQPSELWDHRCAPPSLAAIILAPHRLSAHGLGSGRQMDPVSFPSTYSIGVSERELNLVNLL